MIGGLAAVVPPEALPLVAGISMSDQLASPPPGADTGDAPYVIDMLIESARVAYEAGNTDRAREILAECRALAPSDPRVLRGLAFCAWWEHRTTAAVRLAQRAARLAPDDAKGWHTLAVMHNNAGNLDGFDRALQRSLSLNPDSYPAHGALFERSMQRGDWRRARRTLRWMLVHSTAPPALPEPRWDGSPLRGRTLLVLDEHGLGDSLLSARYFPVLADLGGTVVLETRKPLKRLWRRSFGGRDRVRIVLGERTAQPYVVPDAAFDCWTTQPLLPLYLERTVPEPPPPPYLHPDPSLVEIWRKHLRLRADVVNVGIIWQCGAEEDTTKPKSKSYQRAIGLDELAPLGEVPGVRWHALQVGPGEDDPAPAGMRLVRVGPVLRHFDDTAAVIAALDLVISIDTAAANLAGAMGAPIWVLLRQPPDWRWGVEESPWYPGVRQFRQSHPGDWSGVVQRVTEALRQLVAERGASR